MSDTEKSRFREPNLGADICILEALHSLGESYGYEIIHEISSRTKGKINIGFSTMYTTIDRLIKKVC